MTTYRAGVIGHTGRGNYGHSLDIVYLGMEEIELVAVADADADGLAAAGERLNVDPANRYQDYHRMLAEEKLDIVSVAVRWLDQHHDMVVAAAAAGVRGIFCEKPFARTPAEADAMIDACDRAGTRIAVSHQSRVNSFALKMKEMIADGVIGEVKEVHSAGKQDHRGGGEDLMVLGTHSLDLLCFLFGRPRWVQSYILQDGHDARSGRRPPGRRGDRANRGRPFAGHLRLRQRHHRHLLLAQPRCASRAASGRAGGLRDRGDPAPSRRLSSALSASNLVTSLCRASLEGGSQAEQCWL